MDIFQHFGHLFITAGLLFTSFLGHNQISTSPQITKTAISSSTATADSSYIVSRNINYQGYNINITVTIPKDGGTVTGTISGDCNGTITGQYDGKDNGEINGQANVSCKAFMIEIPGTAIFTGTINKLEKNAQLEVNIKIASFEKSQSIKFSFN